MALATQCPHCHTTFRVAQDQLKLRDGLVRCGSCKEIFNGIEHLLPPEDDAQATVSAPQMPVAEMAPAIASDAVDALLEEALNPSVSAPPSAQPIEETSLQHEPAAEIAQEADPLSALTAETPPPDQAAETPPETPDSTYAESLDFISLTDEELTDPPAAQTAPAQDAAESDPLAHLKLTAEEEPHAREMPQVDQPPDAPSDDLEQEIKDLVAVPLHDAGDAAVEEASDDAAATEFDEPDFVKRGRRQQRIGRAVRILMGTTSFVLLLGLIGQGTYTFRDQIAAKFPQAKPALVGACSFIGCQVGFPAQIDAVSIESSELQVLDPDKNTFTFTALLRNHSPMHQTWPNIELTLNDANEKAMARRVFTPRDYLPSAQDWQKGFTARSEQTVKLFFELSQLKASGYRVYLFYP